MKKKTSIHHLLPKFSGGSNNNINKQVIRNTRHQAHHTLFGPANIPEQIEIVIHNSIQILRDEFVEQVLNNLEEDPEFVYRKGVYIPRKYKKHTR